MAKLGARQVELGIGIEATPGTAVAATINPQWTEFSVNGVSEKMIFKGARGQRIESSNSAIRRRMGKGNIGVILDPAIAPYLFGLTLGSRSTALTATETIVYDHTLSVNNANASMKTFTLVVKEGPNQVETFTNCVIGNLNLDVTNEWAKLAASIVGNYPTTGGTLTPAYTSETLFGYYQMTAKFGATISAAIAGSATPIRSFSLHINNNVLEDESFVSGANVATSGQSYIAGAMAVTGSYTLHFDTSAQYDAYKAGTKNAMVVDFLGAAIGTGSTETIEIRMARLTLTKPPMVYNLDGLVIVEQDFTVEYNASEGKGLEVMVRNLNTGTNYV